MKQSLSSYLKIYNNALSLEECADTIRQLNDAEFEEHKFYNDKTKTVLPQSPKELDVSWDNIPNKKLIGNRVYAGIGQYIKDLKLECFDGWSGFSNIRFNKYTTDSQMAEHVDHIKSMFDGSRKGIPILSVVGVLNDDYKGGEFVMWGDTEIELAAGDLMIFPSVFLYPHRVNLITQGTRYTYVSWVW